MKKIEEKILWIRNEPDRFIKIDNSFDDEDKELFNNGFISINKIYDAEIKKSKYVLKRGETLLWEFDFIGNIVILKNWDEVFYAKIWEKSMFVRLKSWKNIGWEFDQVGKIKEGKNGNEYFLAKKDEKESYINFSSRLPVGWEFDHVWSIYSVYETWKVFQAKNWEKQYYIDLNTGKNIGWEFDYVGTVKKEWKVFVFRAIRGDKMMYIDFNTWLPVWWEFDKVSQTFWIDKNGVIFFEWLIGEKKLKINIQTGEQINTIGNAIKETLSMNVMDILKKKII